MQRREFLGIATLAVAAASMAANERVKTAGAPMRGFADKPLDKVRVGVIGIGGRGTGAVTRLCKIPGVQITAVCDLLADRVRKGQDIVKRAGFPEPKGFVGPEGYKQLADAGVCDVVHINTNWISHTEIALRTLQGGLHTLMEVPGCRTIEQGWQLIEASEKYRRHCAVLANCSYGDQEMMLINVAHQKVLGEIMHAEGCYLHNTRAPMPYGSQGFLSRDKIFSSLQALENHTGMCYPVHQFGPIALALDINRGDRLDHLVSMGNEGFGWQEVARKTYGPDAPVAKVKFEANDFNTTLIRTAKGKSIMLRQCNNCPMPYCREYKLYGFNGTFNANPLEITIEKQFPRGADWMGEEEKKAFSAKYRSPMWAHYAERAHLGGHGGMDYFMDFRWSYCLRKGLPLDIDVYDLATWSSIFELSERSVRNGSQPQNVPDFTRGAWKTLPPVGDMSVPPGYV